MEEPKWIVYNKLKNTEVKITKASFSVGRNKKADIICRSGAVSRNHANLFVTDDDVLYVQDNESLNGTYVNKKRIRNKVLHKLNDNDEVVLGLETFDDSSNEDRYIFIIKRVGGPQKNNANAIIKLDTQKEMNVPCSTNSNENQIFIKKELPEFSEVSCIKQEIFYENIETDTNGYTINDAVIVIDCSDDSDDELPCSQFLNSETAKKTNYEKPPAPPSTTDSLFQNLKQELEDMESQSYGYPIFVDDEPDDENPDLLALLESGVCDKEIETNNVPIDKDIQCTSNNVQQTNNTSIETHSTAEEEIPSVPSKKFYTIPPLVAPHIHLSAAQKRKKESPKTDKKRKSIKLEKDDYNLKKPTKLKIDSEARKNKLKAIAKKSPTALESPTKAVRLDTLAVPSTSTSKIAAAKVKVSDSRGKYLMEPIPKASCSLKNRVAKLPVLIKHPSSTVRRVVKAPPPSNFRRDHNIISGKSSSFPRIYQGLEDIIVQLVSWNPNWFVERNSNKELPPINSRPLQKINTRFSSYTEYYNIMKPLLMVEMWNFLHKESVSAHRINRSKAFKCKMENYIVTENHSEIDCYYYISQEDHKNYLFTRDEDAIFIGLMIERDGVRYRGYYLGCVANMKIQIISNNGNGASTTASNIYAKVNIKIISKLLKETVTLQDFDISVLTTLVSTLRLFRSVKFLERSALCDHILKPNVNLYNRFHNGISGRFSQKDLNCNQKEAVASATKLCLGNIPGIYLIHGPPGTGKSTVIINIIKEVLFANDSNNKHCILVTASSNGAVDEIMERLTKVREELDERLRKEMKLVRIGPEASIRHSVKQYSIHDLTKKNMFIKCESQLSGQVLHEFKDLQAKISHLTHFPKLNKQLHYNKEQLTQKCKDILGRSYGAEYRKIEEEILRGARIICTTLSSCIGARMEEIFGRYKQRFSCCLVDEATQGNEVETLIPLKLGIDKLVLIGDPKQLPAIVFSKEAKTCGYGNSLFSRISSNFKDKQPNPIKLLNMQYRMHLEICKFPNLTYYHKQLENSPLVLSRKNFISTSLIPYLVFEFETNVVSSQQYSNKTEQDCVIQLIHAIDTVLPDSHSFSLGIITPYNDQKNKICEQLQEKRFKSKIDITVNTVDSFQGQEKDIIIMSCVRISANNFVDDDQRLNVALTRAKSALYVIGSKSLFQTCYVLNKLRNNAKERNLLKRVNDATNLVELIKLKPSN